MKVNKFTLTLLAMVLMCSNHCQAQSLMIPSSLGISNFQDLNLMDFTFVNESSEPNSLLTISATLSLNGNQIASQSERIESKQVINGISLSNSNFVISRIGLTKTMFQLGFLPEGSYELCITISSSQETESKCASFVHTAKFDGLAIQNINPPDGSTLYLSTPQLSWTSLMLPEATNDLSYTVILSEASESRSKFQDSQSGLRIFERTNYRTNAIVYPASATPLEDGKEYIWNVELTSAGQVIARSKPWRFKFNDSSLDPDFPVTTAFVDISTLENSPHYFFIGEMKLKNFPSQNKENVGLKIYDSKGEPVKLEQAELVFTRSNPELIIDLTKESTIKHLEEYNVCLDSKRSGVKCFSMTFLHPLLLGNE